MQRHLSTLRGLVAGLLLVAAAGAFAMERMSGGGSSSSEAGACQNAKADVANSAQARGGEVREYGRCACGRAPGGAGFTCGVQANVEAVGRQQRVSERTSTIRTFSSTADSPNESCTQAKGRAETVARSRAEDITEYGQCNCGRVGANLESMQYECSVDARMQTR